MQSHTPLFALALLFVAPAPAVAAEDASELKVLAAAVRAEAGAPALGLLVVGADGEPRIAVAGLRAVGSDAKVTALDKWHLGSITKSITATLVARLVERGVVAWDDTLDERLGDVAPEMHLDYREVSFRQLLVHRSGLPANIPMRRFSEFGQTPDDALEDRARWVRLALSEPPVGPMDETFSYSNNGFIVAGAMLESATGKSWEELMRREVFEPLELKSAGFGPPRGAGEFDQPRGHTPNDGVDRVVPIEADNPAALGPAGRVHMTLADMARYLRAHATRDESFLSLESYETLHAAGRGRDYAMGWVATGPSGRWHNGSNTMWYAEVAFDFERGTAACVVVNDGDLATVQAPVNALLRELMQAGD